MVPGGLMMLAVVGMTYTFVVTPEEDVNIGGGYAALAPGWFCSRSAVRCGGSNRA